MNEIQRTFFSSMVIEKYVNCEKKANKLILEGKMRNHPPYTERNGKKRRPLKNLK